jgi:tungstate transport system substrate-binding protein
MKRLILAAVLAVAVLGSAWSQAPSVVRLRIATTTSTEQSGLLGAILPVFEKETGYRTEVVAVGTGASLKIGEKGDCDVVIVHARALEDAFMAAGFGADRRDLMYNDFVILGPASDPAGVAKTKTAFDAFSAIAKAQASFISRGDKSGTDVKEKDIWKAVGIAPKGAWYKEAGQGMSQCIMMADQMGGYTLSDRATWLAMKDKFPLKILSEGDQLYFNPYGVITINPLKWPQSNYVGAVALMDWLTSPEGRRLIAEYKISGEQCFYLY